MRPTPGSKKMDLHSRMRNRRKPPRGMYMNPEDVMAVATGPPGQGEMLLRQLDAELVALKRQVRIMYDNFGSHKQNIQLYCCCHQVSVLSI